LSDLKAVVTKMNYFFVYEFIIQFPFVWSLIQITKTLSACAIIFYFLLTVLQWMQLSMNDAVNSNRWIRSAHDIIEQVIKNFIKN